MNVQEFRRKANDKIEGLEKFFEDTMKNTGDTAETCQLVAARIAINKLCAVVLGTQSEDLIENPDSPLGDL